MPIRSQLDTSMYRGSGNNATIGDILSIVNTIRGAAQSRRDREKLQKEEDDLKFVNSTVGKYMQGYAGNDPDDLYQRRQGAYNEILTQRPELQSYVGKSQDADMKGQLEADKNALDLQNDQATLDTGRATLAGVQQDNLKAQMEWKMKRATDATQGLSNVSDQFGFSKWRDDYSDVVGDKITPYYEDFVNSSNPADVFWRDGAGQVKQKRLTKEEREIEDRDLLVREKESGIGKNNAEIKYKGAQVNDLNSQVKKRQWDMDNPKETNQKVKETANRLEMAKRERDDVNRLINDLIRPVGVNERGETIYEPTGALGMNPAGLAQFWRGSNQGEFTKKVNQLRDKIALSNREKLKGQGQISDMETKMLLKASTVLGTDLNKQNFLQELTNLQRVLNSMEDADSKYYNSLVGPLPSSGGQITQPQPDNSGYVIGQKKFSQKYGRELTYIGGGEWE